MTDNTETEAQEGAREKRPADAAGQSEVDVDAVLAAVAAEKERKSGWIRSLGFLVLTGVLFVSLGLLKNPAVDIVLIVAILLVHEAGHFIAMKACGYRDMRMFFIPLLGAAVSGRHCGAAGYKRALVCLSGPLPGIWLGIVLLALYYASRRQLLLRAATLTFIINLFNLAPIMPLDGGRFMAVVLFRRNLHVELVFDVLATLALFGLALALSSWVLGVVGVLMLMSVPRTFRIASVVAEVRPLVALPEQADVYSIPRAAAAQILKGLGERFKIKLSARHWAQNVIEVWDRLNTRPLGVAVSALLLGVYAGAFAGSLAIFTVATVLMRR